MNRRIHGRSSRRCNELIGVILALLMMSPALPGCASSDRATSPYASPSKDARDPARARELTRRAAKQMDRAPEKAKELLRRALAADLYHGPAHNNLGVLHLKAGRLYEAAGEFEWARKLMPGHPDPRLNLGLALEEAGRIDDALASYESALEVYPNHLAATKALARCQLRHNRADDRTPERLRTLAMRGDHRWRAWAKSQLRRVETDEDRSDE